MITDKKEALKLLKEISSKITIAKTSDWTCASDKDELIWRLHDEVDNISPILFKDKDFVMKALETPVFGLRYVDESLINDEEVVLQALKYETSYDPRWEKVTEYISSEKLRNDPTFLKKAKEILESKPIESSVAFTPSKEARSKYEIDRYLDSLEEDRNRRIY